MLNRILMSQNANNDSHLPLDGKRILVAFAFDLTFSIRIQQLVTFLREQGAIVDLVTSSPESMKSALFSQRFLVKSWEFAEVPVCRIFRRERIDRAVSRLIRGVFSLVRRSGVRVERSEYTRWMLENALHYDLIWAIDLVSLPGAALASKKYHIPFVYETFDLVAEYTYVSWVQQYRRRMEARYISQAAMLVTAGGEYARYYQETYKQHGLSNTPFVVHNSLFPHFEAVKPSSSTRKFIFFGNIIFDRPIEGLLRAFAAAPRSSTLTIMGKNHQGDLVQQQIDGLGLCDRVFLKEPCLPEEGVIVCREYDIGVALLDGNDLNEQLAPTAKLGTYLAAGLAIMATDLPGMRDQLGTCQAVYCQPDDQLSWAQSFCMLAALPTEQLDAMKQSSLERAAELNPNIQLHKLILTLLVIFSGGTKTDIGITKYISRRYLGVLGKSKNV